MASGNAPPTRSCGGRSHTTLGFEGVRASAVFHAVCPVSLEDLRSRPDEVGALLYQGRRVESALYHKRSVVAPDGTLLMQASPVLHLPVDDFKVMPLLSQWKELLRFLDRDSTGWICVTELSVATAAALPMNEDSLERFIRDRFEVAREGMLSVEEVGDQVLPYLSQRLLEVLTAAPALPIPELHRKSSRQEVIEWFNYWDQDDTGEVSLSDLRFAMARTLYAALGDSVDCATREAVVALFLLEEGFSSPDGALGREHFVREYAPALQANLPLTRPESQDEFGKGEEVLRSLMLKVVAPFSGQTAMIEVPAAGTVGSIRAALVSTWGHFMSAGQPLLFFNNQHLDDDAAPLRAVPSLGTDSVVLALSMKDQGTTCVVS